MNLFTKKEPSFKPEDFTPSVEFVLNIILSCTKPLQIEIAMDCIFVFVVDRFKNVVSENELMLAKAELVNAIADQKLKIAKPDTSIHQYPTLALHLPEELNDY